MNEDENIYERAMVNKIWRWEEGGRGVLSCIYELYMNLFICHPR